MFSLYVVEGSVQKTLVLSGGIFLLLPLFVLKVGGLPLPGVGEPSLSCSADMNLSDGHTVRFNCVLKNNGDNNIFVLDSPLIQEGPRSDQPFPRRHTGGDRYENILEFDRGIVEFETGNIMFDPYVVPQIEVLPRMWEVSNEKEILIAAIWHPDQVLMRQTELWWTVRLKLVYTSQDRLQWLQSRPYIEDSCPGQVLSGVGRSAKRQPGILVLETRTGPSGRKDEPKSCEDSLSLILSHLYSNHIAVNLRKAADQIQ